MPDQPSLLQWVPTAVGAGLAGAIAMTLFMHAVSLLNLARAPMIVAVGSLFTKRRDNALPVGWAVHLSAGTVFGILYGFAMVGFPESGLGLCIGIGALIGTIHGIATAIALVAAVSEQHPLEEFRTVGFNVALTHAVGHIVYGLVVGLIVGLALPQMGN